jgi:CheY-like chemotaxis protein
MPETPARSAPTTPASINRSRTSTKGKVGPVVLVIDDDPLIRKLLTVTLRGGSFTLLEADSALEGLRLAREVQPRVIFLDIRLAGEDGLRVCNALKSDPATKAITVFMLSAHSDAVTRERARRRGADGFFSKPFSPLAIWAAVDKLLL